MKEVFTWIGHLYNFVISLLVTSLLGVVTWGCWQLYQEAHLDNLFVKEGQRQIVQVGKADMKHRSWRDWLGNTVYLTFTYQGKDYTTRYVANDHFVGRGDTVQLLYIPKYDTFRQPARPAQKNQSVRKSRLVGWTTIRDFNQETALLLLCVILGTAFLFLASGLIVTIIPVPFLQTMARIVLVAELLIATVFLTYDTWQYLKYYQRLKEQGQTVSVQVIDTRRHVVGGHSSRNSIDWYDYEATVRYQTQEWIIVISEHDYDILKPKDSLQALYSPSVNDLMAADAPHDYVRIFMPLVFGLITFILLRSAVADMYSANRKTIR
ncbi:hypothetical protein GCM10027592_40170 [Spirosoma flavus]